MRIRFAVLLSCQAIAACSTQPTIDTAALPFAAFGTMDNDVAAANIASADFASPARTANNPAEAARAAAGIDYLAGQLSTSPRWLSVSPLTKQLMLQARTEVRRVLGIPPTVPSQVVVNALLFFAAAWQGGNQAAALQMLAVPGFGLPPDQMVRVLSNMPYIQSANVASMDAAAQMLPGGEAARHL